MCIVKARETMTAKARVLAALHHQPVDRVPIDYAANPSIDQRLKAELGLALNDNEGLRQALGVDFRAVGAPFCGPQRFAEIAGRQINPEYGFRTRWIEHSNGDGYWDFCDFPLREATLEEVEAWPLATPDDYDYSQIAADCRRLSPYAVYVGHAGIGDIINNTGLLRGMEQVLIDLITDDPAGLRLIDRKLDLQLELLRRTLEAARGGIDFLWMGEDLGTQISPIISLELYRRHLRPRHQKIIDLARAYGLPVMVHTCGASSWAYEDFIEMGVTAVDTLQPEATGMAPQELKDRFGGRLAFHGCISTTGALSFGTPADVAREVRNILEIMEPQRSGGYLLSPAHMIQDNSPVANVLELYRAAHLYGG